MHHIKQHEGGPIGLRSTCALARVVMGRWDIKWNKRMAANNIMVEDDGRFPDVPSEARLEVDRGWVVVQEGVGGAGPTTLPHRDNEKDGIWEHARVDRVPFLHSGNT